MASVILAGTTSTTALNLTGDTSGELQLKTNNGSTTAMTLTTAGNVGIGTASPVSSAGYTALTLNNATNSGYVVLQTNGITTSDWYVSGGTVATIRGVAVPLNLTATGANYISATTNGSERMRIDSSGNVGIGTSSPGARLDVATSTAGFAAILTNTNGASDSNGLYIKSGTGSTEYNLRLSNTSGSTDFMTVKGNGNVGIGTSSPAQKLHVQGGAIEIDNGGGAGTIYFVDTNAYINYSSSTMQFATNGSERMRIDSSGNVLVGTSTANSAKFAVNSVPNSTIGSQSAFISGSKSGYAGIAQLPQGQLFVYDTNSTAGSGGAISFGGNAGGGQETWYAAIEARKNNSTAGDYGGSMVFYTRPNGATADERMRIDSSGRVLINNPTSGTQPLTVQADTGNAAASFYSEKAAGNATDIVYFYSLNKGALLGYIGYNGSQVTYNATSDYRLKENIAPMTDALAKVAQLKPCTYTWKQNNTNGQGFIAHELADVFPEAVSGKKDELFEDGSIKPQGVDTSFLVATLTAAIQEQQAMIEELKQEVAKLKGV